MKNVTWFLMTFFMLELSVTSAMTHASRAEDQLELAENNRAWYLEKVPDLSVQEKAALDEIYHRERRIEENLKQAESAGDSAAIEARMGELQSIAFERIALISHPAEDFYLSIVEEFSILVAEISRDKNEVISALLQFSQNSNLLGESKSGGTHSSEAVNESCRQISAQSKEVLSSVSQELQRLARTSTIDLESFDEALIDAIVTYRRTKVSTRPLAVDSLFFEARRITKQFRELARRLEISLETRTSRAACQASWKD